MTKGNKKRYEKPKWVRKVSDDIKSDLILVNADQADIDLIEQRGTTLIACIERKKLVEQKEELKLFLQEIKKAQKSQGQPKLSFELLKMLSARAFGKDTYRMREALLFWDALFCCRANGRFFTTRRQIGKGVMQITLEQARNGKEGWITEPHYFDKVIRNWWGRQQHCQGATSQKTKEHPSETSEQYVQFLPLAELRKKARQAKEKPSSSIVKIKQYQRNPYIVEYIKRKVKGKCQLCENNAPFKTKDGNPYLECHHIHWLSKDGKDCLENTVALCPNCHKRMHIKNSKKDRKILLTKVKALASKPVLRLK